MVTNEYVKYALKRRIILVGKGKKTNFIFIFNEFWNIEILVKNMTK